MLRTERHDLTYFKGITLVFPGEEMIGSQEQKYGDQLKAIEYLGKRVWLLVLE